MRTRMHLKAARDSQEVRRYGLADQLLQDLEYDSVRWQVEVPHRESLAHGPEGLGVQDRGSEHGALNSGTVEVAHAAPPARVPADRG